MDKAVEKVSTPEQSKQPEQDKVQRLTDRLADGVTDLSRTRPDQNSSNATEKGRWVKKRQRKSFIFYCQSHVRQNKKKEETCCQYLIFIYVFILNSYLRSYFKIPFQEQSRSTASYGHSKLWVPSYWFSWRVYAAFLRNISAKLKEKVFSLFPVPRSSLFVFKLSVWFLARWVKVTLAVGEDGEGGAERQRLATDTDILTLEQPGRVTGWWWVELGETALFIC